jgi:hypothetical protein
VPNATCHWRLKVDPLSIATAAVSLLGPYFAQLAGKVTDRIGQSLGDKAMGQLDRLYEVVKGRLDERGSGGTALERMRQRPDSERDQGAVEQALEATIAEDDAFGARLLELIQEAQAAGVPAVVQVSDAGAVALRGDVQLRGTNVAGRDMTIQGGQRVEGGS